MPGFRFIFNVTLMVVQLEDRVIRFISLNTQILQGQTQ